MKVRILPEPQPLLPQDYEAPPGPPLGSGDGKQILVNKNDEKDYEATVAKLAYWLDDEAVYMRPANNTPTLSEDQLQELLATPRPWLYADERDAILSGNKRRLQGDKDAWLPVAACLRQPTPSPLFLATVADLLEMKLLRVTRPGEERAESKAELVVEYELYTKLIMATYKKMNSQTARRWAKEALAYNRRTPGEPLPKAIARVVDDLGRGADPAREARYTRLPVVLHSVRKAEIRPR